MKFELVDLVFAELCRAERTVLDIRLHYYVESCFLVVSPIM